jgi:hypothetical protein
MAGRHRQHARRVRSPEASVRHQSTISNQQSAIS